MSDDFYQRLDRKEAEERVARIFKNRPENLHDYQGCANDDARAKSEGVSMPTSEAPNACPHCRSGLQPTKDVAGNAGHKLPSGVFRYCDSYHVPEPEGARGHTFEELSKGFEQLFKIAEAIELADIRSERQDEWNLRQYRVQSRPSAILSLRDIIKAQAANPSPQPNPLSPQEEPLSIEVKERRLVISIGVGTLAFAFEHGGVCGGFRIVNPAGFAEDVRGALLGENESGDSNIGLLLDRMMIAAIEDGSTNVEEIPDVKD